MSRTQSTMLELGTSAPDFSLPDTDGNIVKLSDFTSARALLVVFMCNHCPYVIHIRPALSKFAAEFQGQGLATVGINSNDVANYPDDSPERMAQEKSNAGYVFPYLYDEDQHVAKIYRAACTPDFFLFDENQKLVYRGQFDESRPKNDVPVTGDDLCYAVKAVLASQAVSSEQKPSMGCNIKWKPGNEPDYFPG